MRVAHNREVAIGVYDLVEESEAVIGVILILIAVAECLCRFWTFSEILRQIAAPRADAHGFLVHDKHERYVYRDRITIAEHGFPGDPDWPPDCNDERWKDRGL